MGILGFQVSPEGVWLVQIGVVVGCNKGVGLGKGGGGKETLVPKGKVVALDVLAAGGESRH